MVINDKDVNIFKKVKKREKILTDVKKLIRKVYDIMYKL